MNKKKYKLVKKRVDRILRDINRPENDKAKKIAFTIAGVGVVVVIAASAFAIHPHISNVEYHSSEHSFSNPRIEQQEVMMTSTIDFENYDLTTIDNFCSNAGSLYNDPDVVAYRTKYQDIVNEKASKWGLDPNLVMAVLTQESRSGKTTNLMQIGFSVWEGVPFKAYDFENNKYVDILLTNDPVLYQSDKYITISTKDLENPSTNISIGCAMLQSSIKSMDYDIPAGVQCYNFGPTTMNDKVFPKTYNETFQSSDVIRSDQFNFIFMNHTDAYDLGDPEYFFHVARFLDPSGSMITVKESSNMDTVIDHTFNYQRLIREYEEYKEEQSGQIL